MGYSFPDYKAGSYHAAEIQYVFGSGYPQSAMPGPARFTPAQLRLSQRIMDYWGAFIRTGSPAAPGQWPAFNETGVIMKLVSEAADRRLESEAARQDYDCAFWDRFERDR